MNFLEKARQRLTAQFRDRMQSRIPPVCGVCDFCGEYEYEGSTVFMCEHKGGPGPRKEAPLVREDVAPPNWCPKRNGIWETMIQVPGLRNIGGR